LTLRSIQLEALKGVSRETGAPVAELARRAVDAFLASRMADYSSALEQAGTAPSDSHLSTPVTHP